MASFGSNLEKPPLPASSPQRFPVALLRHELQDGSAHFDLLIADRVPTDPDAATVPTYRVARRPDLVPAHTSMGVERIPLHRERYLALTRSAVLSEGRGTVSPLRRGSSTPKVDGTLEIIWEDGALQCLRVDQDGSEWTITVLASESRRPNP